MRVGVQLPEVEREVRWPELAAIARAAEECGFDSIWLGDHLLYRGDGRPERGPWELWTSLAALAAVTSRVRIGSLVACLAFHPPGLVAKMAATVDEVSGGRFTLGAGAGWNAAEFDAFGLPADRPVSRFAESFEVVRRALAGERVTYKGASTRARELVVLPPPRRRIPLMVGSNGPRMLALTLPHVDAWNTWYEDYGNTPEGFAGLNRRITAACDQEGRDPRTLLRSACVFVSLDPDSPERPVNAAAPPVEGGPEAVTAHLRALAAAGADEAILVVSPMTETSVRELAPCVHAVNS